MGRDSNNNFAVVLALLAVFSGSWLYLGSRPLESQRPSQQAANHQDATGSAMVRARLWQDPLEPIQAHWNQITGYIAENGSTPPGATLPMTIAQFASELAAFDGRRLRLVVLTPGGPYADDTEQRSRHRYAIVSSLTERDFVPRDGEHIGYFVAPSFSPPDDLVAEYAACKTERVEDQATLHNCFLNEAHATIGYEFFVSSRERNRERNRSPSDEVGKPTAPATLAAAGSALSPDWKSVLVLWVNEDDIVNAPLQAIDALMASLDEPSGAAAGDRATVVIGPSNSGMLQAMYLSAKPVASRDAVEFVKEARTYRDNFKTLVFEGKKPRTVADEGFDPDPAKLDELADAIVASVDEYLDYGLPPGAHESLFRCLGSESALDQCFDALPEIEDSDRDWRNEIKGFWSVPPRTVRAAIEKASGDDADIRSLLLAVHEYLDRGLTELAEPARLGSCLRGSRDDQERLYDESAIAACLEALEISDSDEDWATTVAGNWMLRNPHVGDNNSRLIAAALEEQRATFVILSPRATAPLDFLLGDKSFAVLEADADARSAVDDKLAASLGVGGFRSMIERDDLVVRNVLVELDARGACGMSHPTIAVISEQDSPYGRFIDDVLQEQATRLHENELAHRRGGATFAQSERASCEFDVQEFGYLRGVDGELPPGMTGERPQSDAEAAAQRFETAALEQVPYEQAVGVAQLDYVRRLADMIALKSLEGEADFVAIGVLGSDVYDKRLILQSLRERLPWITFFTTDLDARLSDADALRWTKNLLVASAYGYSMQERFGAAFRDGYQTSTYRAVHVALSISADNNFEPGQTNRANLPGAEAARLFEISRSGPVEIPSAGMTANGGAEAPLWTPDARSIMAGILLMLPLLGLALTTALIWRRVSSQGQRDWHRTLVIAGAIALAAAVTLGTLLAFWNKYFDEPWRLFEGISSVPTLVLHLTAAVFAVCLTIITYGLIVQGNRDVAQEFNLPQRSSLIHADFKHRPAFWISKWTKSLSGLKRNKKASTAKNIWITYLALNRGEVRLVRIAVPTVLWSAVAIFLFHTDPTPLLSHGMHLVMEIVRGVTVFAVLATVFYCTDALHLGQILVRALALHDVRDWKKQSERPRARKGKPDPFDAYTWRRLQTMELIVRATEIIGPVVVFPFVLMFLLIVARNPLFEGWVWSTNQLLFYFGFGAHILVRALRFQFEAAKARDCIRHDLQENLVEVAGTRHTETLECAIAEVERIDRGAFVPWTQHPILQSVALPSSGLGLISLANAFLQ
jgi:hypothetical protein